MNAQRFSLAAVNPIYILEGRSSNLWYGSFFPDAPPLFESAQSLAAEKAAYARDVAGQQVGVVSERAKFVTSEWGKKAGVELPWSPTKSPAAPPKVTTTSSTMGPSSATGVDSLHGLNVPQTTPQKRVDPAKVPLPETPAPVNAL